MCALNMDWTRCSAECRDHIENGDTGSDDLFSLGCLLMGTGMSELTKENLYEVYMRGCLLTRLAVSPGTIHPEYLTIPCLLKWIGLKGNVAEETRREWSKRILDNFTSSLAYQYTTTMKELKDAAKESEKTSEPSDTPDAPDSGASTGQEDSTV